MSSKYAPSNNLDTNRETTSHVSHEDTPGENHLHHEVSNPTHVHFGEPDALTKGHPEHETNQELNGQHNGYKSGHQASNTGHKHNSSNHQHQTTEDHTGGQRS